MRSSNSGPHSAALVCAKMLCVICATLIILLELLSTFLLKQYSGTYLRVLKQYGEAVASRHADSGEPSVLIVGNSLLLAGVDVDRHRREATNCLLSALTVRRNLRGEMQRLRHIV